MCAVHFLLKNEVLRRRGLRHVAFGFKMTWKKQNRSPLTSQKKEKSLRHRVEYDYNMSNFQLLSIKYCRTLRRKRCKRSLKGTFRRNPQQHSMKRSQRGALCMNVSDFKKTFDVLMTFSRLPGVFSVADVGIWFKRNGFLFHLWAAFLTHLSCFIRRSLRVGANRTYRKRF